MLHKPNNQKLLLTNILNTRSNSTIINESKPMRITKRYKTQSYNNLYDEMFKKKKNVKKDISVNNKILSTRRMNNNSRSNFQN